MGCFKVSGRDSRCPFDFSTLLVCEVRTSERRPSLHGSRSHPSSRDSKAQARPSSSEPATFVQRLQARTRSPASVSSPAPESLRLQARTRSSNSGDGVWLAYSAYALLTVISTIAIPLIFPVMKWYYVIIAYMLAPALGFCNAYGAGLTDMNMAYNYGKMPLFIFAAWAGKENGVVAGLVGCGLIKSVASISADLMHDFKTGHLTLTSPRSSSLARLLEQPWAVLWPL